MNITKKMIPFREFLNGLKILSVPGMKGGSLFSPAEIDYLSRNSISSVYEFVQEQETDREFYESFIKWLHEEEQMTGYVEFYLIVYLRKNECLDADIFCYLERNVTECFEKGRGWLYQLNHRMRFRLRIQLICCLKKDFQRLVMKDIYRE